MRKVKVALRRGFLFALALVIVIFVRVALYCTKFTHIRRLMIRTKSSSAENEARAYIIAHAVRRAAGYVPKATCMTQALSAQAILSWFGVPTDLVLGAARAVGKGTVPTDADGTDFHAWLTWKGKVILGGEELEDRNFAPLSTFSSVARD